MTPDLATRAQLLRAKLKPLTVHPFQSGPAIADIMNAEAQTLRDLADLVCELAEAVSPKPADPYARFDDDMREVDRIGRGRK